MERLRARLGDVAGRLRRPGEGGVRRVYHLHIPKTGGTSLDRLARRNYPADRFVEHFEQLDWKQPGFARRYDYISGHPRFVYVARHLDLDDFLKVTVLRDPLDHIVSHIAWVRRLAETGEEERFAEQTPEHQARVRDLARVDLGDASALRAFLAANRFMFDNFQTRHLLVLAHEDPVGPDELARARRTLKRFDLVGLLEAFPETVARLCRLAGWQPPRGRPLHLNRHPRRFGLDPDRPVIRDLLEEHSWADRKLHQTARARFRQDDPAESGA